MLGATAATRARFRCGCLSLGRARPAESMFAVMHRFANPARFMRIATAVLPWSAAAAALLIAAGLYFALFRPPADRSEARRVGKECVRSCRSRGLLSP